MKELRKLVLIAALTAWVPVASAELIIDSDYGIDGRVGILIDDIDGGVVSGFNLTVQWAPEDYFLAFVSTTLGLSTGGNTSGIIWTEGCSTSPYNPDHPNSATVRIFYPISDAELFAYQAPYIASNGGVQELFTLILANAQGFSASVPDAAWVTGGAVYDAGA